ncbi:MAG: hypothetical protein ACLP4W_16515 [Mycobacterium sp.]
MAIAAAKHGADRCVVGHNGSLGGRLGGRGRAGGETMAEAEQNEHK